MTVVLHTQGGAISTSFLSLLSSMKGKPLLGWRCCVCACCPRSALPAAWVPLCKRAGSPLPPAVRQRRGPLPLFPKPAA